MFERLIDRFEQRLSAALGRALFADYVQHIVQRAAGNVLHVHQLQAPLRQMALIVHAHNMGMIELRQRLRLDAAIAGNLQRHQPLHRKLACEKHRAERAFS